MSDVSAGTSPAGDALGLTARDHPLRAALSREMHLRRLPRFASPCRLLQVVTVLGEGGASASHAHAAGIAAETGRTLPPDAKYAVLAVGDIPLVWERHTEFATYTLILAGAFAHPFDPVAFAGARAMLDGIPGEIVRATQIALTDAEPPAAWIAESFHDDSLVASEVAGGKACVWSDFQLHEDGFGRLLVADRGLAHNEPAELIQRLQELGNYRNMALLGLPLAQALAPEVSRLEQRLAALTLSVAEKLAEDDALLDELSFLSGELARLLATTHYRMSATRAYAQLSQDRLQMLLVGPVAGYQTLGDFTERRLTPAVRTCDSFSQRLEDLSQRTAWTSSLLRTRIDTALARQNRDLLASMNRRTRLQLRLQQTVEGLSVVAISYYLVALIGDVLHAVPRIEHDIAVALAVPVVLIGVAWTLRHIRRRHVD